MLITLIAGARPNFMKIAPLIKAIQAVNAAGKDIHYRLVHTGQHYDKNMSAIMGWIHCRANRGDTMARIVLNRTFM